MATSNHSSHRADSATRNSDGYWERTGVLRTGVLGRWLKAGVADGLIGQSCLGPEVALVTRDRNFRNFARYAGLRFEWG